MTHTPTPWYYAPAMQTGLTRPYEKFDIYHVTPIDRDNSYGINTGSQKVFLGMVRSRPSKSETEANAALIVRAVNSHDALVEALEDLEEWFVNHVPSNIAGRDYHLNSVRKALSRVK